MAIPSSLSLIFEVKSTGSELAFGRLRQTSDVFGRLRTSSGIFGNDRVVFKNPSTPRITISRLYLSKSWQVYHAIIPPCNYICQIINIPAKKKKNKERGRQKKKIIVFCLFPLYDVKSRYLWHSPSHIVFFLWLLSLLPTVYHLKRSQLSSSWHLWTMGKKYNWSFLCLPTFSEI